jgi:hypothetical protein
MIKSLPLYLPTMAKAVGETPLMQQHNAIKAKYPDVIKEGNFFENSAEFCCAFPK